MAPDETNDSSCLKEAKEKFYLRNVENRFNLNRILKTTILCTIFSLVVGQDAIETPSTTVPEFISKGGNIVAKENSQLKLQCEIKDLGDYTFMWKFNSKFLFLGSLVVKPVQGITKDNDSNSIIIDKLRDDLVGIYRCEISSDPPKSIQYDVSMPAAPIIVAKPHNKDNTVVVNKGKALVLNCNAKQASSSPITFKWIHNSKTLNLNSSEFSIDSVQLEDSGQVICDVSNEIGSAQHTFKILVKAPPIITVSDKVVHGAIGNDVQISCTAKAYPPAKIEWFFGNSSRIRNSAKHEIVELDDKSTLQIHNVDPKDHDNYFCQATNDEGIEVAYFEVTGRPSKPKFTSPQVNNGENSYLLEWVVFSQTPILSHELRLREVDHTGSQPTEWKTIQVEANNDDQGPLRRQSHMLENLSVDKNYEVEVEVGNEFGKTKSDIFAFATTTYNGIPFINPSKITILLAAMLIHILYFVEFTFIF